MRIAICSLLLAVVLALVPGSACAQQTPTFTSSVPLHYDKLAFTGYSQKVGVDPIYIEELILLTEDALRRTYTYEIIEARDCLKTLLENGSPNLIDCSRTSCLKRIGRIVDADFVAAGTIEPDQQGYKVKLVLVDPQSGRVLNKSQVSFDPDKVFPEASLRRLVRELLDIKDEQDVASKRRRMVGLYSALVRSAIQYFSSGDEQRALQTVERATGLLPDEAEAWTVAALIAESDGDMDRAQELFEQALKVDPNDVGALQVAADFYERHDLCDKAVELYAGLVELEPDVLRWVVFQANALLQEGRTGEALELYRQSIVSHPDSLELAVSYTEVLLDHGDMLRCVEWLNEVGRRFPGRIEFYSPMGRALAAVGRFDEAVEVLEIYVTQIGPHQQALDTLWPLYVQTGQSERMLQMLNALAEASQDLNHLHLQAATAALDCDECELAIKTLEQSISLEHDFESAYRYIAYVHKKNDSLDLCIAYFHRLARKYRRETHLPLYFEALCTWIDNRPDRAVELYIEVIEQAPAYIPTYLDLAAIYMERKAYDRAEVYLERAAEIDPASSDAYHGLGDLYFLRQDWIKAKRSYRKAISLDPRYPAAYHSLVEVMLLSGDFRDVPIVLQGCQPRLKRSCEHVIHEYLICFYAMGARDRQNFALHLIGLARWYHEWSKQEDETLGWDFDGIRPYVNRFQGRDRTDLKLILRLLEEMITLSDFLEQMGIPDALGRQI